MALFHFTAGQISRGGGQSSVASAAYRAGEKLMDEYYGQIHDYTKKHGVVLSEIILPEHAPERFADRQTLWNEVEKVEKHPKAQLAYSFDFALQNELSIEENIRIAKEFIAENFTSRGMIVDMAVHEPGKDPGDIPNPHDWELDYEPTREQWEAEIIDERYICAINNKDPIEWILETLDFGEDVEIYEQYKHREETIASYERKLTDAAGRAAGRSGERPSSHTEPERNGYKGCC